MVERSDVIGAIFGQTEGLFGPDLDLRELQKTGRVGRIEIEIESKQDETNGRIIIPSSLDKPTTSLIAAAVESVDRVGPCDAKVTIEKMEDAREARREKIISRAKEILQKWTVESMPTSERILKEVSEAIRPVNITSFGPERCSAGPEIEASSSIIVVEGRADVANLLKSGFKNVIACKGTKIPKTIIRLSREKEVTAFLDGDRGGDLILKGLLQVSDIDYVARAPKDMEVEDLTPKQIHRALSRRVPIERLKEKKPRKKPPKVERKVRVPEAIVEVIPDLKSTLEAVILDGKMEAITRIPVSELAESLKKIEGADTIVFDGVITQRLVDIAGDKGVRLVIGDRISEIAKRPVDIKLLTFADIEQAEE